MKNQNTNKKKSKKNLKNLFEDNYKLFLGGIIFLIAIILWSFWGKYNSTQEQPEKQVTTVKKTDLQIVISGDGQVKSANIVELDFPFGGTVSEVLVEEGDVVKKGDILAKLDPQDFLFEIKKAETDVKIARANLTAQKSGPSNAELSLSVDQIKSAEEALNLQKIQKEVDLKSSKLDIQTAEIEKEQAARAFQSIQTELENDIKNVYENAILNIAQSNIKIDESLVSVDKLLGEDVESDIAPYIGGRSSIDRTNVRTLYKTTSLDFKKYILKYKDIKTGSEYPQITEKLNSVLIIAQEMSQLLHDTKILLDHTIPSVKLSQTDIENLKNNIFTQHTDLKKQLEILVDTQQEIKTVQLDRITKIRDAQEEFIAAETKLKNANVNLENTEQQANISISSAENQVKLAENQHAVEIEQISPDELALYEVQLLAAINELEQAKYNYEKTIITAPFNGQVININQNIGEQISTDKETSFITIQESKDFLSIEAFIEEIDIIKITKDQKVYITFDALDSVKIEGNVSFVSPVSSIDENGIVTYKVVARLKDNKNISIREGMTAYLDFVIAEAKNVLAIPVEAVKNRNGVPQVQLKDLSWKKVSTGFTDGKMVEIINGLSNGETILY